MKRFDEFKSESEFIFDLGDGLVKRVPVQVHGNSDRIDRYNPSAGDRGSTA